MQHGATLKKCHITGLKCFQVACLYLPPCGLIPLSKSTAIAQGCTQELSSNIYIFYWSLCQFLIHTRTAPDKRGHVTLNILTSVPGLC